MSKVCVPLIYFSNHVELSDHTEMPKGEDYVDENGIRTTVEYSVNEDGKKVKVRRLYLLALFLFAQQ